MRKKITERFFPIILAIILSFNNIAFAAAGTTLTEEDKCLHEKSETVEDEKNTSLPPDSKTQNSVKEIPEKRNSIKALEDFYIKSVDFEGITYGEYSGFDNAGTATLFLSKNNRPIHEVITPTVFKSDGAMEFQYMGTSDDPYSVFGRDQIKISLYGNLFSHHALMQSHDKNPSYFRRGNTFLEKVKIVHAGETIYDDKIMVTLLHDQGATLDHLTTSPKFEIKKDEYFYFASYSLFEKGSGYYWKEASNHGISLQDSNAIFPKITVEDGESSLERHTNATAQLPKHVKELPGKSYIQASYPKENMWMIFASDTAFLDNTPPGTPRISKSVLAEWSDRDVSITIDGSEDLESGIDRYEYKLGTGAWQTYTTPFVLTSTQTITARAINGAGSASAEASSTVQIDKVVPIINSVTGNAAAWQSGPVTLSINATFGTSGAAAQAYSFDGGSTWQNSKTKTFSSNQTVSILARSTAGKISSQRTEIIDKIDTSPPAAPVITKNPLEEWSDKDVVFTVTGGEDVQSGIARYEYKLDSGTWQEYKTPVTVKSSAEVAARTINGAGSSSTEATSSVKIDRTPPTAPTIVKVPGGIWNNNDVTFTVEGSTDNESDIAGYEYKLGIGAWQKYSTPVKVTSGTEVKARAINKAGSFSPEAAASIKIDRTPPAAPNITKTPDGVWSNTDVTFTVDSSIDAESGVAKYEYKLGDGQWQEYTSPVKVEAGVEVLARAINGAGSFSTETAVSIKIDSTPPTTPTITKTPDVEYSNTDVEFAIGGSEDDESGIAKYEYKLDEGEWNEYKTPVIATSTQMITTRASNGAALLSAEASKTAKIDKTIPTITKIEGNPSEWTTDDATLKIEAEFGLSGIPEAAYSFDGGVTWQNSAESTFSKNQNVDIAVRNVAGTISAIKTQVINRIDKNPPVPPKDDPAAIPPEFEDGETVEPDDKELSWSPSPTVIETQSGALSGIAMFQHKVEPVIPQATRLLPTFKSRSIILGEWIDTLEGNVAVEGEGVYKVEIRSVSNAGQPSEISQYIVKNDYTPPQLEYVAGVNTISVTASDNLSGVATIVCEHGTTTEGTVICPVAPRSMHEYTITDNAGNVTEAPIAAHVNTGGGDYDDGSTGTIIPPPNVPETLEPIKPLPPHNKPVPKPKPTPTPTIPPEEPTSSLPEEIPIVNPPSQKPVNQENNSPSFWEMLQQAITQFILFLYNSPLTFLILMLIVAYLQARVTREKIKQGV